MKSTITTLLFAVLLTAGIHAEQSDADRIIEILNIPLIPEIQDNSLSKSKLEEKQKKRREAIAAASKMMAANLEKEMSSEELKTTLQFLESPAGKKFYGTINGQEFTKGLTEIMRAYYREGQNQ